MRKDFGENRVQNILLEIKVEVRMSDVENSGHRSSGREEEKMENEDRKSDEVGSSTDWNTHDKERIDLLKYLMKNIF